MYKKSLCIPLVALGLLAGCASYETRSAAPVRMDGGAKSVCNGPCAVNWPPLFAADNDRPSGEWSIVTRDDGKRQWAFRGKPLYSWIKDQKPGDRTGEGVNNAWRIAKE